MCNFTGYHTFVDMSSLGTLQGFHGVWRSLDQRESGENLNVQNWCGIPFLKLYIDI